MGRPVSSDPREYQLNISFTEAEITDLRLRANAAQMRLVEYGRLLLMRKTSAPIVPPVAQIDRIAFEQLKRLGNNLNQIARVLNATRNPPPEDLAALLNDIRRVLNRGAILGP